MTRVLLDMGFVAPGIHPSRYHPPAAPSMPIAASREARVKSEPPLLWWHCSEHFEQAVLKPGKSSSNLVPVVLRNGYVSLAQSIMPNR